MNSNEESTGLSLPAPKLESKIATPTPSNNNPLNSNGLRTFDPSEAYLGDQGASKLFGELTRAQYDDWHTRFSPYISKLGDMAGDTAAPQAAADEAISTVGDSFSNAKRGLELSQQRLGLQLSPEEQAVQDRRMSLSEGATSVQAANTARTSTLDRQQKILAGSSGVQQVPNDPMNQMG
ncbi:MAG: hypothetical protein ACKVJE_17500 [Pseudomonadales bacterium]